MSLLFETLFAQYSQYPPLFIYIEATAIAFGLVSVWFSIRNSVLVFPTGLVSTTLFMYLLLVSELLGDLLINAYYFLMSIYGWFYWSRREQGQPITVITEANSRDKKTCILIFISATVGVFCIYLLSGKLSSWTAYVDTFTTAVFFVGMWLMAKRKIQHWLCWILGDAISIPLYAFKGLLLTSVQFFVFTLMAVIGYYRWRKILNAQVN